MIHYYENQSFADITFIHNKRLIKKILLLI